MDKNNLKKLRGCQIKKKNDKNVLRNVVLIAKNLASKDVQFCKYCLLKICNGQFAVLLEIRYKIETFWQLKFCLTVGYRNRFEIILLR